MTPAEEEKALVDRLEAEIHRLQDEIMLLHVDIGDLKAEPLAADNLRLTEANKRLREKLDGLEADRYVLVKREDHEAQKAEVVKLRKENADLKAELDTWILRAVSERVRNNLK